MSQIQFFQSVRVGDETVVEVPWRDWMAESEQWPIEDRRAGDIQYDPQWRTEDRTHGRDAVLVAAKDTTYKPSVSFDDGRVGPAPTVEGRYANRLAVVQVSSTVYGLIRFGQGAPVPNDASVWVSARTGWTEQEGLWRFRPIVSPQFIERMQEAGKVAARAELITTVAGARGLYGDDVFGATDAARQRQMDDVRVKIEFSLQTRKRSMDSLDPQERQDGLALFNELQHIVLHAGDDLGGELSLISESAGGRREKVYLSEITLKVPSRIRGGRDAWPSEGEIIGRVHEAWASVASQVEHML